MKLTPKVFVITLNYNGRKHLEYFMKYATQINYTNYEILVVDNSSDDSSVNYLKKNFSNLQLLELDKNYGYAQGFNHGIKYALKEGAEYILITNNDVVLDKEIIREGLDLFFKESSIGYMGGKVYNLTEGRKLQYAGGRTYKSNRLSTSRGAGEYDKGQYEDVAFFDFIRINILF